MSPDTREFLGTLRYYIATSLERAGDHRALRRVLEAHRLTITYDWTSHGSVQHLGQARVRQVALAETEGVTSADVVIVLLPGGRGTHVELGIAIGARVPVLLVISPEHEAKHPHLCAFYLHPCVRTLTHTDGVPVSPAAILEELAEHWPWGDGPAVAVLLAKVVHMRAEQRRYFKTRDGGVLQKARRLEAEVDDLLSDPPISLFPHPVPRSTT